MKKLLVSIAAVLLAFNTFSQTATEIITKADNAFRGKSSKMEMTMTIERPKWTRTIKMKSWTMGEDYSMVLITSPEKDKGQVFLKRKKDLWNWIPKINRMVKMPPSMMSQGWMGSDVSNDDLLRQSSLVTDYTHKILATETISGRECWKIELTPKEDADIMWGKIQMWISKTGYLNLKSEYFDEDMYLAHTEIGSNIKVMDGKDFPTKLEIIPADEPQNKTILEFTFIDFDIDIDESFFSQQKMKTIR